MIKKTDKKIDPESRFIKKSNERYGPRPCRKCGGSGKIIDPISKKEIPCSLCSKKIDFSKNPSNDPFKCIPPPHHPYWEDIK